jgi:hypothetical protein
VTTAVQQHTRPGRLREAWGGFGRWRRTRPFWGGLLTTLAGLEIFSTTQMSLRGLSFQMGPTGFLSWLVPAILVTCGQLMWFRLQHRVLYAVVAAVTALFSLIGVNLGGFFIGLLLGIVGSALGFAWVLDPHPAARPGSEPAGDGMVRDNSSYDGRGRGNPTAGAGPDLPASDAARARPSARSRPSSMS